MKYFPVITLLFMIAEHLLNNLLCLFVTFCFFLFKASLLMNVFILLYIIFSNFDNYVLGVWCPVCNQGFTRHYNLKVHMYKSHGKDYLENNFSSDELESLMRPPPGSNTSKASTSPKHLDKDDIGVNTSLPISPPLTPKLSPRLRYMTEDQPQIHLALDLKIRSRPGPASLTKTKHYFEQESMKVLSKCKSCDLKFVYKVDCDFHYEQEHKYEDEDLQANDSLQHQKRKPGPASRTNAPIENRVCSPTDIKGEFGFTCTQCGKVLMHKQSYVSHMRVIHGDYYGGNKWNGSRVVDMVLGDQSFRIRSEENKNYSPNELLLDPSDSGHNKRQSLTVAFDHNDIQEPDTKRLKLSQQGIKNFRNIDSSKSVLSFPDACTDSKYEPLDLACKPVSVCISDEIKHNFDINCFKNGNNLLQVVSSHPSKKSFMSVKSFTSIRQNTAYLPSCRINQLRSENDVRTSNIHEYAVKQNTATADETGKKKFLCPVCLCQLSWKTNLSVHLRTHSGERPFQCILCFSKFRQKAHLYKHFRCSHGQKVSPFKCIFCSKLFTRSSNDLYNHITEVHEHDVKKNQNNNTETINNNCVLPPKENDQPEPLSLVMTSALTPPTEEDRHMDHSVECYTDEDSNDDFINDRNDDIQFEPVTQEFLFEGQLIKPSYCVLPFVTEKKINKVRNFIL